MRVWSADPVIKIAIEPKSKGDLEKMSNGLIKLAQEDPSFHFTRDEETNQTVIEGMGELHLDIIVDRLRREFKVILSLSSPMLPKLQCEPAAACMQASQHTQQTDTPCADAKLCFV